jgi:hypothetical protein
MSMQDTGFVQIPVERFLELVSTEQKYTTLSDKVTRDNKVRESRLKNMIKYQANRDSFQRGHQVQIILNEVDLLRYLRVDDYIRANIIANGNSGVDLVDSIAVFLESKYDEKEQLLKEVTGR